MSRTFEDVEAKRARVPLMIGLVGPSGGGKTFSALRLATGIQRVTGKDIFVVDTEARRSLHYADRFRFRHLQFDAPFGPLDYLAAIEHCARKGAGVIIVDSMSHEHEGPGGVLEMHATETKRLAKLWGVSESKAQMSAWAEPKAERRRMINTILQLPISAIFCFRAKDKLKIQTGKDPVALGFMPIAGEEFVYEMAVNCLLLPNAGGVPTWRSDEIGERMMIKLPEQFRDLFAAKGPLSEDIGEALARWAEGTAAPSPKFLVLQAEVQTFSAEQLDVFLAVMERAKAERSVTPAELQQLRDALSARAAKEPQLRDALSARRKAASKDEQPPPERERQPGED